MECAANGAVRYIKIITSKLLMLTVQPLKNKATPVKSISTPNDVAFVVACILLYRSRNLTRPMEAISTNNDPVNSSIEIIKSFMFHFFNCFK